MKIGTIIYNNILEKIPRGFVVFNLNFKNLFTCIYFS